MRIGSFSCCLTFSQSAEETQPSNEKNPGVLPNQKSGFAPVPKENSLQNKLASIRFLFAIMPHMAITRRQKEVLDFISGFVQRNGYSPSFEEIARGLDLRSLATVHKHITNLQSKGLLARAHNRSRSLDVLPPRNKSRGVDRLPLAGRIAAGYPVEAPEIPESISLGDIIGNRDVFALQVRGESMRDDHIVDGDFVLVERTSTARSGEIVVALVRGAETTLKRYFPEGPLVRLQPANPEMNPVFVPASQVAIQGRVLGMLRKY
jgi:repressor LexA